MSSVNQPVVPHQLNEQLLAQIQPYTLCTRSRLENLARLADRLNQRTIPGDFVECGTYKGGSAALLSQFLGSERHLWLYDSFQGMPPTSSQDGPDAAVWVGDCVAAITDVEEVLGKVGAPQPRCHIQAGWFQETFQQDLPQQVALLHCDADWYESVLLVLETFYDRIPLGGCIVLDDFGYWEGCREAFYDFCSRRGEKPLLERLDSTQAYWIKGQSHNRPPAYPPVNPAVDPAATPAISAPLAPMHAPQPEPSPWPQRWDYISPGLAEIDLSPCFPNRVQGDADGHPWAFLRREIPHRWYVDRRHPMIGFLSPDEAHILYNTARRFQGQPALEVGCWMGWSACHLAAGGVQLDVVDPVLAESEFYESVSASLECAGVRDRVHLVPGYSPQQVQALVQQEQRCWALIFIDGNHEGTAPLEDARCCEQFAAADAMILFHDLASPMVAQGLEYLRQRGWQTKIYHTMQIMGVAWRGNVEPVVHQPDPRIAWPLPQHLQGFAQDPLLVSPLQTDWWATLAAQQAEIDRLRQMLDNFRLHLESLSASAAAADPQLEQLRQELALAHKQISAMKSSKFWKLRRRWMSLKRHLGLGPEE
jgi:predicted O-methyltransferase YrrM